MTLNVQPDRAGNTGFCLSGASGDRSRAGPPAMDLTPVMTRRTVGVRWPSALRRSRPSPRRSAGPRRSASCGARRSRRIRARGTTPTPTPGCSRTSHRRSTRTAPATHATATIALNAALGFNCYRFGIEWSRIEPSPGQFSDAELDHYERVLQTCHAHGQTPIGTLNHFSAPLWFAERSGWDHADAADLFAPIANGQPAVWGR